MRTPSCVLLLQLASFLQLASAADGKACTFMPHCDFAHGSREKAAAATKEACCSLCNSRAGCAAGVLSGGECWFKAASDVAHGCQQSSKVDYACVTSAAPPLPPPPPAPPSCETAACKKLEAHYSTLQNTTCDKVVAAAPVLDPKATAAFMKAYQAFKGGNSTVEAPVFATAQALLDDPHVEAFLSLPDSFGSMGGLDASMVLCAVLRQATPTGLAEFSVEGPAQQALVTKLLNDPLLMRDMLVAGGPAASESDKGSKPGPPRFGQAMSIYEKVLEASDDLRGTDAAAANGSFWDDRSQGSILRRLALGTALEHAVPIHQRYHNVTCDEAYDWCPTHQTDHENDTFVDPIARYLHYERAYKMGDLDPALEVLTTFECRHTTNSPASNEDLTWLRRTLAIYRPDHIAKGYDWRYADAVRTEVAYGDPQCAAMPGICDGHYAQIPASDGVCGPRAFFGRFTRLAFGLPVWGATQPGHAAMTTWSPDQGWHVLLGAGWPFCWWGGRSGPDFVLEAQARETRAQFQKVLRGGWVSDALGEPPVGKDWGRDKSTQGYGEGGVWGALMLYAKKLAVEKHPPPPRPVGPSVVPTKVAALLAKWPSKLPTPKITTDPKTGTITIPAVAYSSKNHSAKLSVMKSMGDGEQLLHEGCSSPVGPPCLAPLSSSWSYQLEQVHAGTYYLTANISTWHPNQDLFVSLNQGGAPAVTVPVYYTVGWWNQTQPLALPLSDGANTLTFHRLSGRELVFKSFHLYPTKPSHIPKPPGNYTPSPPPPYPPSGAYIEVPADTSCVRQGITPVPEEDCERACYALGFKPTGPRARPNITGCFVLTEGQYKGNCNYNTNASATCTPPCELYGAVVRSLCIRK